MDISYTESFRLNNTIELFLNTTNTLNPTKDLQNIHWSSFSMVSAFLCSTVLTLSLISAFLRIGITLKLFIMVICGSLHLSIYQTLPLFKYHFTNYTDNEIPWQIKMWAPVIVLVIVFHMLDRKKRISCTNRFFMES